MTVKEMLIAKFKAQEEKNKAIREVTPPQYAMYLMEIEKSSKLKLEPKDMDAELKAAGCYVWDEKVFQRICNVYFTVMGKLAQFIDLANEKGLRFTISEPKFYQVQNSWACEKTITLYDSRGNVLKKVTGTASVGFNGSGVDSTNPMENAETSALGRALTFLGMGICAENIASADEMLEAERRQQDGNNPVETPVSERYEIEAIGYLEGSHATKVQVVHKESGERKIVWLQELQTAYAKSVDLQKGDLIDAVIGSIQGTTGEVSVLSQLVKVAA